VFSEVKLQSKIIQNVSSILLFPDLLMVECLYYLCKSSSSRVIQSTLYIFWDGKVALTCYCCIL